MKNAKAGVPHVFVEAAAIVQTTITISGTQHHHLSNVLRLKAGAELNVLDNNGHLYQTVIQETAKSQTICKILASFAKPNDNKPVQICLAQALLKGDKLDWVIQKATELGVAEIVPLITTNTVVKLARRDVPKKLERWQAIAQGAAEQSERWDIPIIREPLELGKFRLEEGASGFFGAVVRNLQLVSPSPSPLGVMERVVGGEAIRHPLSSYLVIGPEGGLTAEEEAYLTRQCFTLISFSRNVLRAETAAIIGIYKLMEIYNV